MIFFPFRSFSAEECTGDLKLILIPSLHFIYKKSIDWSNLLEIFLRQSNSVRFEEENGAVVQRLTSET